MILAKRGWTGMSEMAASVNRLRGSGGGIGVTMGLQKAENTLLGQAVTGGFTLVTGSAVPIPNPYPLTVLVLGYILINWTNGAQTAVISPFIDGVQVQNLAVGPAATLASPANVPICYTTLLGPNTSASGHIIDLRVAGGAATTYNIQSFANYVLFLN